MKVKNKKAKDTMDEMQERNLLKIEEKGFWIIFWSLFAAIIIQILIQPDFWTIVGEAAVLLIAGFYIAVSSLKRGLWSKGFTPSLKANATASVIPAFLLGFIYCVRKFLVAKQDITLQSVVPVGIRVVVIYVACFVLLEIVRAVYQKKRKELDDIDEEV